MVGCPEGEAHLVEACAETAVVGSGARKPLMQGPWAAHALVEVERRCAHHGGWMQDASKGEARRLTLLAMGFGESGEADLQVCSRTILPDGAEGWLDAANAPAGGDATGNAQRVPLAKMCERAGLSPA